MSNLYQLPEKRDLLSKENLLKKQERVHEEEFPINAPGYDGFVVIRAIKDDREYQNIMELIEYLGTLSRTTGIPISPGINMPLNQKQIFTIVLVAACMKEPDINYVEAIHLLDTIPAPMSAIANRIALISGLTSGSDGKTDVSEEKLRNDPFSSDDIKSKFGIVQPASE